MTLFLLKKNTVLGTKSRCRCLKMTFLQFISGGQRVSSSGERLLRPFRETYSASENISESGRGFGWYLLGEWRAWKKAARSISREALAVSVISVKDSVTMLTNRPRSDRLQSTTVGQAPIGHGRTQGALYVMHPYSRYTVPSIHGFQCWT